MTIVHEADGDALRTAIRDFSQTRDANTGSVLLALMGRFVSTTPHSYLLPEESADNLAIGPVLTDALSLGAIYALAAQAPSRALVIVGEAEYYTDQPDGLVRGVGFDGIPQGKTVTCETVEKMLSLVDAVADANGDDVLPRIR